MLGARTGLSSVSVQGALDEVREPGIRSEARKLASDVALEFGGLGGYFVRQLGSAVDDHEDVVQVEAAEHVVVAAAFPGRELGCDDAGRGGGSDLRAGRQAAIDRGRDRVLVPRV
jgi:hypothetical protein